jgi:hypothetical protein
MTTKIMEHVDEHGVLPTIKVTNWGSYIALVIKIADLESTVFMKPGDMNIDEYIEDVREALGDFTVSVANRSDYV